MFTPFATESDVTRLLRDPDRLTVSRILAIAPSRDELGRAICEHVPDGDEASGTPAPRDPSSARIAGIREILRELTATGQRSSCPPAAVTSRR